MTTPNETTARLEAARTAVRRAAAALEADQDFDLRDIEREADLAAAAATARTGSPAERDAARKSLINLVADLNDLHEKIKAENRRTAERLGRGSESRRAYVAYGQRG